MNHKSWAHVEKIIGKSYAKQSHDARNRLESYVEQLLDKRKIPEDGWTIAMIELFLQEISSMDSNNFSANIGVGEREARIYCSLVAQRHFYFGHGMGRSGDLCALQPKAAGSSLLVSLVNELALDALYLSGIAKDVISQCLVVPLATGMSILMTLCAIRKVRPEARYVLWPRIDQKSCFKSLSSSGFIPVICENELIGDEVRTNIENILSKIVEIGSVNIAAVVSTTSCFAPRATDRLVEIGKLCRQYDIPHIVNNAYGLQSEIAIDSINKCGRTGRMDVIIQSSDKNFMVPVGGAILASANVTFLNSINSVYPGRASISPTIDLLITLLNMGRKGYKKLLLERKMNFEYMRSHLKELAEEYGCRLLHIPNNDISLAISLDPWKNMEHLSRLGAMLFTRCVSGCRLIIPQQNVLIDQYEFFDWGAHITNYGTPYLTSAAAIGMKRDEIDVFLSRLKEIFSSFASSIKPANEVEEKS